MDIVCDTGVIFNVSPKTVALLSAICINDKNSISMEFLEILNRICQKGNRIINGKFRLFSMFYIKELGVIYDFCNLIEKANNKFNDIYENPKNKCSNSKLSLNNIINFGFDIIRGIDFDDLGNLDINNIVYDFKEKFMDQDFIKQIKEEIFEPRKNGNLLKILDGNNVVDIINNLKHKIPSLNESGFNWFDFDFNPKFFNDYISTQKPLVDSIKLGIENFMKQSDDNNFKCLFILSDDESKNENIDEDTLNLIKKNAEINNIIIVSIYLNTGEIKNEHKFYDSYENYPNLFSIGTTITYDDPLMRFLIEKGWELPPSGECNLFIEVNDTQNLYKYVDLLNDAMAEINNSKSSKGQNSFMNSIATTAINTYVSDNIINNFDAINQGHENTCYANSISVAILITLAKFPGIPEIDFLELRNEIINSIELNPKKVHKNTFKILNTLKEKYNLSLNEVDEIGARKAIMKSRICVARFGLTKNQWKNFKKFYKDNPKGILRKKDLGNPIGNKLKGHAVILTSIYKDSLKFLNSYGTEWGDKGYFRIKDAEVLNAKFIEVYIDPKNFTTEEKNKFDDFGCVIKENVNLNLFY